MLDLKRLALSGFLALTALATADKPITVTFLHSNDMHAHIEGATIQRKAYGGYARQATLIKRLRASEPNVVLLNAGDTFQGTLYFNVYEGLADLAYMNAVHYDAMALGNHEFDRGPATLSDFVKHADFPILCSNLDFSHESTLSGLVQPSTVLTIGGEKIGVVGAVTPDVFDISSPGAKITLKDLKSSVQTAVDDLTRQKVDKIVLLTHIGYEEDLKLVHELHDVDVVIGGHSHTPLGTPDLPGWPKAQGPYPTMAKDSTGQEVPVVQCWEWSKVFGELEVRFDANGKIEKIVKAQPIVVDESIPEDPSVASMIAAFQKPIANLQKQVIGQTDTGLPRSSASRRESPMANVIADAMLAATAKSGSVAAFVNSGGVRAPLEAGPITYGEAISVQPFNNTLTVMDLTGAELKAALEEGVPERDKTGGLLNPSHGTSYKLDFSRPEGSRISDIVVAGTPLDPAKTYRVTFLNFTANGGDAHLVLKNSTGKRTDTGLLDIDALVDYVKAHSPVNGSLEGRIVEAGR
ncbi:MAG TPA: bifunctional metallophosphatase/5'-nucleotidase [Fimbriimonadaceae bacterium]|nr:bifunctional metallophosphatase/5'-nucleotidase [Fimbriimonadaceae bacterium]